MEFDIEICAMFIMKSRKRELAEGTELQNQKCIWKFEEKEN